MLIDKKTKIVATIGPASDTDDKIEELIKAGVNVFRFNTKHNVNEWHKERIDRVYAIANRLSIDIGILIDLQGPELRLETPEKKEIIVKKGEEILVTPHEQYANEGIYLPKDDVFRQISEGDSFLIDDGFIEMKVTSKNSKGFYVQAMEDSVVKHRKGVNLPGIDIDMPSLIEEDINRLELALEGKVDFIALSFTRSKEDIDILRREMDKRGIKAAVISKIENQKALENLDEIIENSDGVMIARGDMGVEIPYEQLAFWQKTIIDKCRIQRIPVITATQMLDSMINNPLPTRAEVTDVANAVMYGTDAIMLSGESASGKYPVRAVRTMSKIAKFNEDRLRSKDIDFGDLDQTEATVVAGISIVEAKNTFDIDGIIVFTETGYTARVVSSYRTKVPIVAVTDSAKTAKELTLSYAVKTYCTKFPEGEFAQADKIITELVKAGYITSGENIVVIHGRQWREPGTTNSMTIYKVK